MEIEVDNKKNYATIINKHQLCIDIMTAIIDVERQMELNRELIKQLNGNFPEIIKKYENKIDVQKRMIARLLEKYQKYNSL